MHQTHQDPVISCFLIVLRKQQEHLSQPIRSMIQLGLPRHGWCAPRQEVPVVATSFLSSPASSPERYNGLDKDFKVYHTNLSEY